MTLPATGPISLNDIANEFGGYPPLTLDSYVSSPAGDYNGFGYLVKDGMGIPNWAQVLANGRGISFSDFYGKTTWPLMTVYGMFGTGLDWSVSTNVGARYINKISSTGVILSDTAISTPARNGGAGATYGVSKGIFLGGSPIQTGGSTSVYNLVSDTGVYGADQTTTATPSNSGSPNQVCACRLGADRAIFTGWATGSNPYQFNLIPISNTGVVGANYLSGISVTYERIPNTPTATQYGADSGGHKGLLFAHGAYTTYGYNLISNLGIMQSDTSVPSGVSRRFYAAAAGYGGNKAIHMGGYKNPGSTVLDTYNLITNTGVIGTDTTNTATYTKRIGAGMTQIGGPKAIYAYGSPLGGGVGIRTSSLISNTGVIASEISCVGTTTMQRMALGYGF